MKIALFSDTYTPDINGVATSTANLRTTLLAHGEDVLLVTVNHDSNEYVKEGNILRIPGLAMMKDTYDYRVSGFWSNKALKDLRAFGPDVIHIQTDGGIGQFGFLCSGQLGAATVYTFHTMYEDYSHYVTKGKILDRGAKAVVRGYVRFKAFIADEFITPSPKIQEYMRSIGVDNYLNVIPTGINFDIYDRKNLEKEKIEALREKVGIKKGTKVIISLGRVAKEKAIEVCLAGYAKFLEKNPKSDTVFLMVGTGPDIDHYKQMAKDLNLGGHFIATGGVHPYETPYYYALGDVFVSASITETQGLTFQESMASGCILFARYDDTLTSLIHDGENGYFFIDEDDFAAKIGGIVDIDPKKREAIQKEALASIEPYSLNVFYKKAKEVYERAIKKKW